MAEPDRLQLGKPLAAAGVAEEDRELVADQFAATVGEDRRQADQARPVLLASVGRGPSDEPGVRGDSAADLGAAFTGGVRAGGLPGRKGGEEKKEGRWSVRELRRNAPKFPVDSCREGAPPAFHGAGKTFRPCAAKNIGRNRGDCRILFEAGKAKWKRKSRLIAKGVERGGGSDNGPWGLDGAPTPFRRIRGAQDVLPGLNHNREWLAEHPDKQ